MTETSAQAEVILKPLTSDLAESFEKLLAVVWQQNWPTDIARRIVRWRYYERPPGHVTWLACVGQDCVAMLDSMTRPYLLYGKRVMVRETADWFCLPEYRRFGLGLRVLRQLRDYPEPVLVVGGSTMTRQILPRLGWDILAPVRSYILPIKARGLAANLMRQKWPAHETFARIIPRWAPFRSIARVPAPTGQAQVEVIDGETWHELPANGSTELVVLLERAHFQWLTAMPHDFARTLGVVCRLDGAIAGFALVQLEPTATGLDGRIVHLQSVDNDTKLLAWIIAETSRVLVDHGADFIRCFVSTPEKSAAIESVGFILSQELPCHWWNRPGLRVPGRIDVDYLRGDDAQPLAAIRGRRLDRRWHWDQGGPTSDTTQSQLAVPPQPA